MTTVCYAAYYNGACPDQVAMHTTPNHSQNLLEPLRPYIKRINIKRKTTLLHQGELSNKAFLVEQGCLRLWHNHEGEDVTMQFFLEGEVVASFTSFLYEEPSLFNIESIVPSVINVIERQAILDAMETSPKFQRYVLDSLISRLAVCQQQFLNSIRYTAQQRYEALQHSRPRLLEIVPQHYIASYLGITPVSLSRIRKRSQNR